MGSYPRDMTALVSQGQFQAGSQILGGTATAKFQGVILTR